MNTTFESRRGQDSRVITFATVLIGFMLAATTSALAANDTWTGGGQDRNWLTPANWFGGVAPSAGDSLFFGGTTHTTTTNNFAADTTIGNITFTSPAGPFMLFGNEIALSGNITNNQVVTPQTINLPLLLSAPPTASIVPNGVLTINGRISGPYGLSVLGGGTMNLSGTNSFTGGLTVNSSSTSVIGADTNLGGGNLVLNNGTLSVTASFAFSTNRGILVGPGWGGIKVPTGLSMSYGGVIANNGGTGGFTKSGYGTNFLSGANTYSGITSNTIGTLVLDFTQPGSPASGIINSSSSLELGGGNAGGGEENVAQLFMAGGAATDVQSFNGTFATFGGSAIIATNNLAGSVNLSLGALSHSPGGTISFVTDQSTGTNHITTTSLNVNSILGGYALISGDTNAATTFTDTGHTLILGTNFAAVDGSDNIVNFTGYSNVTSSSTLVSQVAAGSEANVSINDTASATVVNVDVDGTASTTDVNALKWTTFSGGFDGISIGIGNTLRLGQFGGIIRNGPSTGNAVYIGGPNSTSQTSSGTTGFGDIGTLTAGGPNPNTPGEIVVVANNASETSGTTIFEPTIADNGTGAVTFVKMGPGSIKLDGHNTFSGGLYLLQGRVQFAGSEIGNANSDGGGFGPIFVLPGAYLFPSGIGTGIITNSIFVAGAGDAHEPLGAFRGGTYSGTVTLIGDANFGGGAVFNGPIVGPYNVTLGSAATINGGAILNNSGDNWTGNTTMTARNNTGGNTITSGAANVIPSGFGYGNVSMAGFSTGTITWMLNGYDQTINGLSTTGTGTTCIIENGATGTNCTLTVGNNDQSGTFGGSIQDVNSQLALTKIGGGIETLTGSNSYSGATTINDGTLAISGTGSISNSTSITVNSGGTLDVTGVSGFSTTSPLQLTGGTLAGIATVGALTMDLGALTVDLSPATTNVTASSLAISGSSNVVNIASVNNISGYPTTFPIIQYSGALSGALNFVFGSVPNPVTGGFFSNDVAHSRIILVLTNGPAPLTWVGNDPNNPTYWDNGITTNWLAFKGDPGQAASTFGPADPVIFDDTGDTNVINLQSSLLPGVMTVTNNALNYTFGGAGALIGPAGLIKSGSGTLTLTNSGGDSYKGGVVVEGGTIAFGANNAISGGLEISNGATAQIGIAGTAGNLPSGNVSDAGSVVFDRIASLTVSNNFTGTGSIIKEDLAANSILNLSGNNGAFDGPINVQTGTLQAGSGNALGTNVTTVSSGATLDVNGQTLDTTALVTVSGAGINSLGAIINSGAANQNALGNVTLAGSTTFGGTNRWDLRGGTPSTVLATSPAGSAYSLTKVGPNIIAIVNATVDTGLGNVDIQQGTLVYQGTTSGLGNSADSLTVESGATLQLFDSVVALDKVLVFNGTGTNDTVNAGSGLGNALSGPMTLNGTCVFDVSSTNQLVLAANVSGGGSMVKIGTGTNILAVGNVASYAGSTTVSNGTLVVDGTLSSPVQVTPGATLAGTGSASGNVTVISGTVSPGDPAGILQGTLTLGNLTVSNATAVLELSTTPSSGNDLIAAGNLALNGTNTLQIVPLSFMNVGDTYTLITYTGSTLPSSATNQLKVVPPANGFFSFNLVDPSTTPGSIQIQVLKAVGNDIWAGTNSANPSIWDTTTTNWLRNGNAVNFNDGDVVTFGDTSTTTNVSISGTRNITSLNEEAVNEAYIFTGTGSLTGVGGLNVDGISLTLANVGSNSYTGSNVLNIASILQLGNGGTNGSIGSGVVTNQGTLVFDRSDTNLVIPNLISGPGGVSQIGTGMTTLTAANTYQGGVIIAQGTLRILNSSALGSVFGSTTVSNGATLDITNTANVGKESITASGAGAGGIGAIINGSGNSTFVAANFSQLLITTNISVGGPGRLDFRASSATAADASLTTTGGGPSFTKVGTNLLQMAGVQIDPTLGDIIVAGGTLGFQWQMPDIGQPTNNLIVTNNASIAFFDMSNAVSKVLTLYSNASVLGQDGQGNEFDGPTTLNSTNTFNISGGTAVLLFANEISGSGSLVKTGPGTLELSLIQTNGGAEIYTGNTLVSQGTLSLLDNATLTNSPAIIMSNSTLVVTGRVDGTLNVGAAIPQTLAGGGVINGIVVENANSLINPGNSLAPALLTVSNGITLNGSVIMDLNIAASAVTNDEIIAPAIAESGALTVTNLGPDLHAGDHFQLFSAAAAGFASVSLPQTNSLGDETYQWRNDLALNGSITLTNIVVQGLTTNASITKVFRSGTNLVLQATNNNVPNTSFRYVVLTSTSMTTPITNWVPVLTNAWNTTSGTFNYTNPIVPGKPRLFFDVEVRP